jgi:DNA-binding IscR family transcriptional regulator
LDGGLSRRQQLEEAIEKLSRSNAVLAIRRVWKDVQAEEQRLLDSVDFAELLRRAQETHELTYQI